MEKFAVTGVLAVGLVLMGCGAPHDSGPPEVLCAAVKATNLQVSFAPALGAGTYELSLETDEGSGTCAISVPGEDPAPDSCTGNLDVAFSEDGFGVYSAPTELSFRLENVESGAVLEDTLTPEYVDDDPDCPHPLAQLTVEPVGMPVPPQTE